MQTENQTFGAYITELREKLGISKSELARRTGMTRAYIGFIEGDDQPASNAPPRVGESNLRLLAKELNVSDQEMFAHGFYPPEGFVLVPAEEYQYPKFRPIHSLIREVGLDEQDFTGDDLTELHGCVEVMIEGYAAKKKRRQAA
jgi:transcriptional regulator with XRE-family HTH domain